MNYRDYIAECTSAGDNVLADWRWLIGDRLELWLVSKAGDAFLKDRTDASIHFLSVLNGQVIQIARDESEFEIAIADVENSGMWLMTDLVDGQSLLEMRPGPNQCLSFKLPPVLGGQIEPDNLEVCGIPVHFSIMGQIHRQTKDMPPGTKIGEIKLVGPAGRRPWWKFW